MRVVAQKNRDIVISPVEDILAEIRNGRMVILVDDEDRENEGDLVVPAQFATPDHINFMASYGRGLVCLAMEKPIIDKLGLPPMSKRNTEAFSTAFTVSIEAKEGVTTGISAPDRARTIQVAIDPDSTAEDIVMPGHVFPLAAQEGGVLVRTGHTEAAVDLARLAGLRPAGVICEIMKQDGTMARLPDLAAFAGQHGLKIGTIADLVSYRMRQEKLVENIKKEKLVIDNKEFNAFFFRNTINALESVALVKGQINPENPVAVRVHALDIMQDVVGGASPVQKTLEAFADYDSAVFLLMQSSNGFMPRNEDGAALRHYGIGAQILRDLGVRDMILLTALEKHVIGLHGFGLNIIEQRKLQP